MIVCLPMYDWPEMHHAHDRFWIALKSQLAEYNIATPDQLSRGTGDEFHWLANDLLLGQTCGYPLATSLAGKVRYIATPFYNVEGCENTHYSSAIIARKNSGLTSDDLQGKRLTFTSNTSWSGYRTLFLTYGELENYFGELVKSGGHRNSAHKVAEGAADIAAIDAVCWHLLQLFEPGITAKLEVIGWTELAPALPFITSITQPPQTVAALRRALSNVLMTGEFSAKNSMLALDGISILDETVYAQLAQAGNI